MKKILVVDDAVFMKEVLKEILEKNGYKVVEAQNGNEAIEKYKSESPDLVILDVTMPELDGIEALKLIRKEDPNAKCIMCSSMGEQALIIESIIAGAKDFIVKPFQVDKIIETVKKII